ncbi:MAG: cation:proton antiporter, partial [Desertimonas sp.]
AQVIADRVRMPSILLLLTIGIVAGPVTGWLEPDRMFGRLLAPIVAYAVGVILFEGGLGLRLRELAGVSRVMWSLVITGTVLTLGAASAIGIVIMDLPTGIALLLASILVVSGPTVVGPLLRVVRPRARVATVLEWEGIIIDPVGAMLAVIVFDAVLHGEVGSPVLQILRFLLAGVAVGAVVAGFMVVVLARFWIPDFLRSSVTLALVVVAFAGANALVEEAGLLSTIVLGMVLANQRRVRVHDIVEFSENLRVPLISVLFIVLAARLDLDEMANLGWGTAVLIVVLVLAVRPLAVVISTARSSLTWPERAVIAAVAPRGIVAASISSVFAIQLADARVDGSDELVPVTFAVIIATVVIYGLGAPALSRRLGVTRPEPQGMLLVGGDEVSRGIAAAVRDVGGRAVVVPGNWSDTYLARAEGLEVYGHELLGHHDELLQFEGLRTVLVLTDNDEFNSLVSLQLADRFGPANVYQLTTGVEHDQHATPSNWRATPARDVMMRGRWLFSRSLTHEEFERRLRGGWSVRGIEITPESAWDPRRFGDAGEAVPLVVVGGDGRAVPVSPERRAPLTPGRTVVALVPPGAPSTTATEPVEPGDSVTPSSSN